MTDEARAFALVGLAVALGAVVVSIALAAPKSGLWDVVEVLLLAAVVVCVLGAIWPARKRVRSVGTRAGRAVGERLPRVRVEGPRKPPFDWLRGLLPRRRALVIVTAKYGRSPTWVDVAPQLNALIENERLDIIVDNETMGSDPVPNHPKLLLLSWRLGRGKLKSSSFAETTHVVIP